MGKLRRGRKLPYIFLLRLFVKRRNEQTHAVHPASLRKKSAYAQAYIRQMIVAQTGRLNTLNIKLKGAQSDSVAHLVLCGISQLLRHPDDNIVQSDDNMNNSRTSPPLNQNSHYSVTLLTQMRKSRTATFCST